jgi:hypothetical protein
VRDLFSRSLSGRELTDSGVRDGRTPPVTAP